MQFNRLISQKVLQYLKIFPCVGITGPRQVGKTTLVQMLSESFGKEAIYLDLESDEDQMKLSAPELYFSERKDNLIIIDEIQRNPALFILLRSVIDRYRVKGRFILLGSASPELLAESSETLAGRIGYIELTPFMFEEVKSQYSINQLWLRGGFPEALIQENDEISFQVRLQFVQSYVERELAILGLNVSAIRLKNLLRMITHLQGQLLNYSQLAGSLGVDVSTLKRYLDFFENAYIIRRLEPQMTNLKKRLVKSPKIYIRDTGMLHALASIADKESLDGYVGKGSSWESFVIQQIISRLKDHISVSFYRTQDGTELDLVLSKGMKPVAGIEIKLSNAPNITRGTTIASDDLGGIPVFVVTHSVAEDYPLNEQVTITSFERIFLHLERMQLLEEFRNLI
jgi:predicted AAA+ superfamily ATPase